MNGKLIAVVAIVAAVAVVGGGAVILMGDGGEKPFHDLYENEQGNVFGNANRDCYINDADLAIIQSIIDGNEKLETYPLADANHDGVVDQTDYELVQKFINHDVETVDVLNFNHEISTVHYPMTDLLVAGGTNMRVIISVLGLQDKMGAVATNQYINRYLDKGVMDKIDSDEVKLLTTNLTTSDVNAITNAHLKGAIVEYAGTNYYHIEKATRLYNDLKMDYLLFNTDNYDYVMSTLSTIGILVGAEDRAEKYVEFTNNVNETIQTKLSHKTHVSTVMTITMSNSVSGTESDYFHCSELAGGKNVADYPDKTRKYDPESGNYWLLDPKYNPDYLFHFKSMKYGETPSEKDIMTYKGYFEETVSYQNGNYYLINGVVPLPVRLSYMSSIMYSELFEEGWADEVFQTFIDEFTTLEDWDVKEHQVLWSVKDF